MPPDPPWKLVAFGHCGLLPQTINSRLNPDFKISHDVTKLNTVNKSKTLLKSAQGNLTWAKKREARVTFQQWLCGPLT